MTDYCDKHPHIWPEINAWKEPEIDDVRICIACKKTCRFIPSYLGHGLWEDLDTAKTLNYMISEHGE